MLVGVLIIYLPVSLAEGLVIAALALAAMGVAFYLTREKRAVEVETV